MAWSYLCTVHPFADTIKGFYCVLALIESCRIGSETAQERKTLQIFFIPAGGGGSGAGEEGGGGPGGGGLGPGEAGREGQAGGHRRGQAP